MTAARIKARANQIIRKRYRQECAVSLLILPVMRFMWASHIFLCSSQFYKAAAYSAGALAEVFAALAYFKPALILGVAASVFFGQRRYHIGYLSVYPVGVYLG